jgi:hypothetical protein
MILRSSLQKMAHVKMTHQIEELTDKMRPPKPSARSSRKPSERFMRSTLKAKSKASTSERIRLADLTSRLDKEVPEKNANSSFNGYRPGPLPPV